MPDGQLKRRVHRGRIQGIAAETEITTRRLTELLESIVDAQPLVDCLEEAWRDPSSPVRLVYRNPPASFVFVAPAERWEKIYDREGLDETERSAVQSYHQVRAVDLLASSGETHELRDEEMYFVAPVDDADRWTRNHLVLAWWFEQLAADGLTPPEIIDYWMTEERGFTPKTWADARDVHPEAVRKNVRQAVGKLSE